MGILLTLERPVLEFVLKHLEEIWRDAATDPATIKKAESAVKSGGESAAAAVFDAEMERRIQALILSSPVDIARGIAQDVGL